jgi:glutamine synthetase
MAVNQTSSSPSETQKYLQLDQKGKIMAEYVWIDADGGTRSKSRTLDAKDVAYTPENLPVWNFDGSSTGQAAGHDSDVYLRPCAVYPDPFRGSPNIIVLSECWNPDGTPNKYNFRHECAKVMEANAEREPWFGLEQEYTFLGQDDRPYGWPVGGYPAPQGPYYCGVGAGKVVLRHVVEAHYKACLSKLTQRDTKHPSNNG